MSKVATIYFQYFDGSIASFDLAVGQYIIGIAGGPADIPLDSKNLSRRHASLTVGSTLDECSIADLGSTNKTSFVSEDESLFCLEPNQLYSLEQTSELLFGDVGAIFEFNVDPSSTRAGTVSKPEDADSQQSVLENTRLSHDRWNRTGKSSRFSGTEKSVDFSVPDSENSKKNADQGPEHRTYNSRSRASVTTATSGTMVLPHIEGKLEHRLVYEHAKEEIGMDLPYDIDLLWIAEMSLRMPVPEGWVVIPASDSLGLSGPVVYRNERLNLESSKRPQSIICRNMYQETKRKIQLEMALGCAYEEESLARLLVIDLPTGLDLFHNILPGRNSIGKGFKTGSSETVDIVLNSRACSKRHAILELRDGHFLLTDLGSTNGTFIGELPNSASRSIDPGEEHEVFDGQLIMFGDVETSLAAPMPAPLLLNPAPRHEAARSTPPASIAGDVGANESGRPDAERAGGSALAQVAGAAPLARGLDAAGTADDSPPGTPPSARSRATKTDPGAIDGRSGFGAAGSGDRGGDGEALAHGAGAAVGLPRQAGYDVQEEVALAAELAALEAEARPDPDSAGGGTGRRAAVPSQQAGYLARSEARRVRMLEWARRYYRRQEPADRLGPWQLPPGALQRVLAGLRPAPDLVLLAAVCRSLRAATYATAPSVTVNGDACAGLWSRLSLAAARCADAHVLIANLGPERLGALTELDLSGVPSVTDATLAAVAAACPLLEVMAGPGLGRVG
jgi:pSer/pThr/pTyr-binding forkhead associated (FHA) protein